MSESNQEIVYLTCSENVEPCSDLLELLFIRIPGGARHSGRTETVTYGYKRKECKPIKIAL